jgi:hypothetical protein
MAVNFRNAKLQKSVAQLVPIQEDSTRLATGKSRTINSIWLFFDKNLDDTQKVFWVVLQIRVVDDTDLAGCEFKRRLDSLPLTAVMVMP